MLNPKATTATDASTADDRPLWTISLAYAMMVFFIFIGTDRPFRPQILDDGDVDFVSVGGTNALNQIFLSLTFLMALPGLYKFRTQFLRFVLEERILGIFILWCAATTFWSADPVITVKRWVQLTGCMIVCFCYVQQTSGMIQQIKPILAISAVFLLVSFISSLGLAGAYDLKANGWRGMAETKNVLGQLAANGAVLWWIAAMEAERRWRFVCLGFFVISVILVLGSKSASSLVSAAVVGGFALLVYVRNRFNSRRVGMGTVFLVSVLATIVAVAVAVSIIDADSFAIAFDLIGKDASFTGRLPLWKMVLEEANQHPILGYGYNAFWVPSNIKVYVIGYTLGWAIPTAHEGYLDILNETGYPGLLLTIGILVTCLRNAARGRGDSRWAFLVLLAMVHNFQESLIFRPNSCATLVVFLAYITQYVRYPASASGREPFTAARPPTTIILAPVAIAAPRR